MRSNRSDKGETVMTNETRTIELTTKECRDLRTILLHAADYYAEMATNYGTSMQVIATDIRDKLPR
jgi:hypothetical protein